MKHYEVVYYTKDWAHLVVTVDADSPCDAEAVARERYNNIARITDIREVSYKF